MVFDLFKGYSNIQCRATGKILQGNIFFYRVVMGNKKALDEEGLRGDRIRTCMLRFLSRGSLS